MKYILSFIVAFIMACITYQIFIYVSDFQFLIAYMGGAICLFIENLIMGNYSLENEDVK